MSRVDRIKRLEVASGGVEAPSRFLISLGDGTRCDEVVEIVDTFACRSHHRHIDEPAGDFASRALAEPGEPWTPVGTDRPRTIDLTTVTDAQLADLMTVGTVLEGETRT